jgi:tetratricopeptide (TPR) repeat protein
MPDLRVLLPAFVLALATVGRAAVPPPPPGVDPGLVLPRSDDDPRARLDLDDVLRKLIGELPAPPSPPDPPEIAPDVADAALRHYLAARDELLQERFLVAATHLERARALDPTSTEILRELAHAYAGLGNAMRERGAYAELYRLDPSDPEAQFSMALVALNQRDFLGAARLLAKARLEEANAPHDPAAGLIIDHALHVTLGVLGYDRASIQTGVLATNNPVFRELTRYRQRIMGIMGRRPDLWREIGDAHVRLGEHREALAAYDRAAQMVNAPSPRIAGRRAFVLKALGRDDEADLEVLPSLEVERGARSEDSVALSRYLFADAGASDVVRTALNELLDGDPDDGVLLRAAYWAHQSEAFVDHLRAHVRREPRDLASAGLLMQVVSDEEAVDVAVALAAKEPDLADPVAKHLLAGVERPIPLLAGTDAAAPGPPSPIHVELAVRIHLMRTGLGSAWSLCRDARTRWPDDVLLERLEIEIAGALDEPELLRASIDTVERPDAATLIVIAAALTAIEDFDAAIDAARRAMGSAGDERTRLAAADTLVRAHAARANRMDINEEREEAVRATVKLAEQVESADPEGIERVLEMLFFIHGPTGLRPSASRMNRIVTEACRRGSESALCWRLQVEEAMGFRQYELGLARALALVERDPTDMRSVGQVLVAYEQIQRPGEAERWLRGRLDRVGGLPGIFDRLVRLMLAGNRTDEARELLEARRAANPDDHAATRLLELVHQVAGDADAALELGMARLDARPEGTRRALQRALLYLRAGRGDEAIERVRWLAERADRVPRRHMLGAIGLCSRLPADNGRREELTAELVEAAARHYPDLSMNVYALGLHALAESGTALRFRKLAERGARLSKGADDGSIERLLAWRELAQGLVDNGHARPAALALRTRLDESFRVGGTGSLERDALALLTSMIIAVDAVNPDGAAATRAMLVDLESKNALSALPGITGAPTLAHVFSAAGDFYSIVGNRAGSQTLLRESIRLDPTQSMTLNNLGYMLLVEGHDDAEVRQWIEQAGADLPNASSVTDTVAWLRYMEGRLEDDDRGEGAISLLYQALEMEQEEVPEMLDHLGDALWRVGRGDEAIDAWRRAVTALERAERRETMVRNYRDLQTLVWGLLVADPQELYDRENRPMLNRTREKLAEAEAGGRPAVTPNFVESLPGS